MRVVIILLTAISLLLVAAPGCARRTPLHEAADLGDQAEVQRLIERGGDVNAISRDDQADSALHRAVGNGHLDVARELIAAGADVNVRTGAFGWTPLHIAATKGNVQMVRLLIDSGAEINALDSNSYTPLDYALAKRYLDVVELLKQAGGRSGQQSN